MSKTRSALAMALALIMAAVAALSAPDDADARKKRKAPPPIVCQTNANTCDGTNGNDRILGSDDASEADVIQALQGSDQVFGRDGDDSLDGDSFELTRGPAEPDTQTDGNDFLDGGPGGDGIFGLGGSDVLIGGDGGDFIEAREFSVNLGRDFIVAGTGDDTILAQDGAFDDIDCGDGTDTIENLDVGLDRVSSNCENVPG